MNIEEIKNKNFSITKKGYNKEEVQNFLADLTKELEKKQKAISNLEEKLEGVQSKLNGYYKIDKKLRNALLLLSEPAKDAILKAKEQVNFMIKEAESKSDEIILSAENEAKSTRDTLLFLKEQQEILIARLKIIIESQEGLLNDLAEGNEDSNLSKSVIEKAYLNEKAEIKIEKILEKLI